MYSRKALRTLNFLSNLVFRIFAICLKLSNDTTLNKNVVDDSIPKFKVFGTMRTYDNERRKNFSKRGSRTEDRVERNEEKNDEEKCRG